MRNQISGKDKKPEEEKKGKLNRKKKSFHFLLISMMHFNFDNM
jgi:hypothetical protein